MSAKTRYVVSYQPADKAQRCARKAGWTEGQSLWDFIEPWSCEVIIIGSTDFEDAFKRAKEAHPKDASGEVRIIRQEFRPIEDGPADWEDVDYWMVYGDTDSLDENDPDHHYADY